MTVSIIMNKKIAASVIAVCTCMVFFCKYNKFYLPSELQIASMNNETAIVSLSWDSGEGFNENEKISFRLKGKNTQSVRLPQQRIKGIKIASENSDQNFQISSLKIVYNDKEIVLPVNRDKLNYFFEYPVPDLQTNRFHPVLFLVQLFMSLLSGWLFYEILRWYETLGGETFLSKMRDCFFHSKQWFFWIMFLLSGGVFTLWLIGQWPGYMTIDSFATWLQIKTLALGSLHPIVYSIYKLALIQFADTPATIAIFQILMTAGLGSYILYFSFKNRVPLIIIFLFFVAFTLSIPINIYNITLWKDVPFSLLVVFWGFYLFYVGFEKKQGRLVIFNVKKLIVLSCILVLTCTMRHNGLIYVVFIPLMLFAARLMPLKKLAYFILTTLFLLTAVKGTAHLIDRSDPEDRKNFFSLTWELNPIAAILSQDWYLSKNHEDDKDTIEKLIKIESLEKKYNPRTALTICSDIYAPISEENEDKRLNMYYLFPSLKKPLSDKELEKIHNLYYQLILANGSIFLSDRVLMFFSALGPNAIALHASLLEHRHLIKNIYKNPEWYRLAYAPKSGYIEKIIKKIITKAYAYNGFTKGRFIVWNAYIPFIFLLCVLMLYKWVPLSALYSFVIMIQVPFLFILLPESDFRYIYFIYLGGFFIIPLVLTEIVGSRKKESGT